MTTITNDTETTSTDLNASTTSAGSTERHTMPRAASREPVGTGGIGIAPLKGNPAQLLQMILFYAGAVLLPTGLVVIGLGWYGAAHTPYEYDQMPYLISGGILGLGITFVGGFLYFGSWLARIAVDQKEAQAQIADALRALAAGGKSEAVHADSARAAAPVAAAVATPAAAHAHAAAPVPAAAPASVPAAASPRATATPAVEEAVDLVVAGRGKTAHRTDCDLIAGREDIREVPDMTGLVPCRLCLS